MRRAWILGLLASLGLGLILTPASADSPTLIEEFGVSGVGFDRNGADFDIYRRIMAESIIIRDPSTVNLPSWSDPETLLTAFVPTDRAVKTMANDYGFTTSRREKAVANALITTLNVTDANGVNFLVQWASLHIAPQPAYTPGIDRAACVTPDDPRTVSYAEALVSDGAEFCTEYVKQGASPSLKIKVGSAGVRVLLRHEWYTSAVGSARIVAPDINWYEATTQTGHGVNRALVPTWDCGWIGSPWEGRCP